VLELLIMMRDDIIGLAGQNPCLEALAECATKLVAPTLYAKREELLEEFWLLLLLRKAAEPPLSALGLAHLNRWLELARAYDKILQCQLNNPIQNLKMLVRYLEVYYPVKCAEDIRLLTQWDHSLPIRLVIDTHMTDPCLRVLLTEAKRVIEIIQPLQAAPQQRLPEPAFADARV
jgi:hypothetical protein